MRLEPLAEVSRVDYRNREYADFYPCRNHTGPGWVVYGRCTDAAEYGGNLIRRCATLVKRDARGRTFPVGWRRLQDARRFAQYLNGTDAG